MPQYQLVCHPTAKRELSELTDTRADRLTDTLAEVARQRQPTQHEKVAHLDGHSDLWRVRAGDCRAICTLQKPEVRVLRVGRRRSVYNRLDELKHERLAEV